LSANVVRKRLLLLLRRIHFVNTLLQFGKIFLFTVRNSFYPEFHRVPVDECNDFQRDEGKGKEEFQQFGIGKRLRGAGKGADKNLSALLHIVNLNMQLISGYGQVEIELGVVIEKGRNVEKLGGVQVKAVCRKGFFPQKIRFHLPEGVADFHYRAEWKAGCVVTEIERNGIEIVTKRIQVGEQHDAANSGGNTVFGKVGEQVLSGVFSRIRVFSGKLQVFVVFEIEKIESVPAQEAQTGAQLVYFIKVQVKHIHMVVEAVFFRLQPVVHHMCFVETTIHEDKSK